MVARAIFELVTVTARPPVGAPQSSVTRAAVELPPVTIDGSSETDRIFAGFTRKLPFTLTAPAWAVTAELTTEVTDDVVIGNVTTFEPIGTVTCAGTVKAALP